MYYDIIRKRDIDLENDVISLNAWAPNKGLSFSAVRHADGFLIFLDPNSIPSSDEYRDGDPYQVSKNIESAFHKRRFRITIELIKSITSQAPLRILDLGCGEGHITHDIHRSLPNASIYGLDYSVSAIRYAHTTYSNINFIVADGYSPPFPDHFFDVIILNNIWEHVGDPLRMLDGVKRVLKNGGFVIISTPSRYRFSNLLRVLTGRKIHFMSKLHVTEYSVGQVKEQLAFAGFTVSNVSSEYIKDKRFHVNLVKMILSKVTKVLKSHHQLESTVFYLARKIS